MNDKHYKANNNKSKGFDGAIKTAALIFCVAITFMFASVIFNNFFISADSGDDYIKTAEREYYCINYGTYSGLSEAQKAASALRLRGGGGYIHNDGKYRVFAALYLNRADADSVCERLQGANTFSVHKIVIPSCKFYCGSDSETRAKSAAALQIFNFTIESLYSVFVELDKNMISEAEAELRLSSVKNQVARQRGEYESVAAKTDSAQAARLKAELVSLEINVGIISEASFITENIAVEIKYYMLKIAFSYKNFVDEIV